MHSLIMPPLEQSMLSRPNKFTASTPPKQSRFIRRNKSTATAKNLALCNSILHRIHLAINELFVLRLATIPLSLERKCKLFFRQDIMSCNGHEDRWKSARFLFASINKLAKLFVSFLMHPCFQGCQSLISIRPDNKLLGRGGVTLFLVFSAF